MLLPIRTSIRPTRTPYVNYALIALNVLFFAVSYGPHTFRPMPGQVVHEPLRLWAQQFMLHPTNPYLWQFVSYAFLHGSLMHIFGNMYFLYLFGNNVNDRLGNVGYLCLYLAGAVFSALGHMVFGGIHPVLGASGAVAAITGAYLVLFPTTLITIMYWFYIIGTMELSALYFIAFKLIVWDNVIEPNFASRGVAYDAHLAGYAFGIAAPLLLLALGLIGRSHGDLWFLLRQWNRRRRYRDVVAGGYDPFRGAVAAPEGRGRWVEARVSSPEPTENSQAVQLRSEVLSLINQRNIASAAEKYLQLVGADANHFLPLQNQLDIANQLMSAGRWPDAAAAYRVFLAHYDSYEHAEQVHLMLGILLSRYLNQAQEAITHLQRAAERLTDPGQLQMCRDELEKLKAAPKD